MYSITTYNSLPKLCLINLKLPYFQSTYAFYACQHCLVDKNFKFFHCTILDFERSNNFVQQCSFFCHCVSVVSLRYWRYLHLYFDTSKDGHPARTDAAFVDVYYCIFLLLHEFWSKNEKFQNVPDTLKYFHVIWPRRI